MPRGRNKNKVVYLSKEAKAEKAERKEKNHSGKPDDWVSQLPDHKQNELFEEYYRAQNILPEEEFKVMLGKLQEELPTTFRVTGSRVHAEVISDLIKKTYVPTMQNVEWEGKTFSPPSQIPWYPGQLAWELSAPKRVVRKSVPFKKFQKFLVGETEVGNLSRQEAVSMIPPLFLDVKPHHNCMDMCAAPGSKTSQIIEALNPHDAESTGLLIANDSDYKRTHMLVHQTGRMPSKGLIITNLDAAFIPNIELGGGKQLEFDRILADVPCSGDGTLRKNFEIWRKWGANDGNSLHALQLRILERGMKALKPGGRLVYSTCSFNPLENEAVVAGALNLYPGQFSLVDVSEQLPELKRRPGITSWKVATQAPTAEGKKLVWHESHESYMVQVEAALKDADDDEKKKKKPLPPSAWPPANANELNLERCMRLVPQDQDTGGFFVCVFEKASDAQPIEPAAELPEVPVMEDVTVADESGPSSLKREASPSGIDGAEPEAKKSKPAMKKRKPDPQFKEDSYSFVDPEHVEVKSIMKWFKLDEKFDKTKLMVRNDTGSPLRTVYLVNDIVRTILENNDYSRMRIVSGGVKSFVRQDSGNRADLSCKWRIPGDGIAEVVPRMPESQIQHATLDELRIFLSEMYPPIDRFSGDAKAWMLKADLGNVIVKFAAGEQAGGSLPLPMILPVWKAKSSMSLLVDKREKSIMSLRVFGEDLSPTGPFVKKGEQVGETEETAAEDKVEEDGVVAKADEAPAVADDEEASMNV